MARQRRAYSLGLLGCEDHRKKVVAESNRHGDRRRPTENLDSYFPFSSILNFSEIFFYFSPNFKAKICERPLFTMLLSLCLSFTQNLTDNFLNAASLTPLLLRQKPLVQVRVNALLESRHASTPTTIFKAQK